jgi:hypothetical protein
MSLAALAAVIPTVKIPIAAITAYAWAGNLASLSVKLVERKKFVSLPSFGYCGTSAISDI